MEIGQSAGKSYAYILGVYLGDGSICKSNRGGQSVFRLNTIDRDFAETVRKALNDLVSAVVGIGTNEVKKSSNPNHSLHCTSEELCEKLRTETKNKQVIPTWISDAPKDERLAFVAGLMDSEGFVARKSKGQYNRTNRSYYMGYKSCDVWVSDFIDILHSLGIRTGKISQEKPRKPWYKTPTRFHIKMQSWIDAGAYFNIRRKQERVEEWARQGPYENRARHPRRLTSETNMPDTA